MQLNPSAVRSAPCAGDGPSRLGEGPAGGLQIRGFGAKTEAVAMGLGREGGASAGGGNEMAELGARGGTGRGLCQEEGEGGPLQGTSQMLHRLVFAESNVPSFLGG